ncbi:hypothetical protein KP509_1Z305100 [Ceratopteris richardii]|nr:hypothetical protein KP509_1Z305100 [Ceratopteris richardii]
MSMPLQSMNCLPLSCSYIRDLLLNPPEEQVARSIQDACKLISLVTCAVPEFTCISAAKLVKLISSNEANHLELSRLRDLVEDVIAMHNDQQLKPILETLIGPTSSATGIKTDCQTLVNDCSLVADKLNNALTSDDDPEDVFTSVEHIPDEFFQTMEYPWRGRIKQKLADSCYEEVQSAAQQLSNAVQTDFRPVLMYVRASDELAVTTARPEIIFSRDNDAIWLKVRNAPASILKEFHGLFVAHDAKGKRVKRKPIHF